MECGASVAEEEKLDALGQSAESPRDKTQFKRATHARLMVGLAAGVMSLILLLLWRLRPHPTTVAPSAKEVKNFDATATTQGASDCSGFLGTWEVRECHKARNSRTAVGIDYWVIQEATKTVAKGYWQSGANPTYRKPLSITCGGSAFPISTGSHNVSDKPMQLRMVNGHAYGEITSDGVISRFDGQKVSYKPFFSFDTHIYEDESACALPAELSELNAPTSEDRDGPVPYEIVQAEDTSHMAITKRLSELTARDFAEAVKDKRMRYRVVVPPTIKEQQVEPTVTKIIDEITSKDRDIDEIGVLLYSDKAIVDEAFDVATATWAPHGELGHVTPEIAKTNDRAGYRIKVEVRKDLEAYLKKRNTPETRLGLSDEQRKAVFREVDAAEGRAEREMPLPELGFRTQEEAHVYFERQDQLREKYTAQVAAEHQLSDEAITAIIHEGVEKNWPTVATPEEAAQAALERAQAQQEAEAHAEGFSSYAEQEAAQREAEAHRKAEQEATAAKVRQKAVEEEAARRKGLPTLHLHEERDGFMHCDDGYHLNADKTGCVQ
jgi:hypothetical protein